MSNIDPKLFARLEGEYASLKDKYASLEDQYEHAMASRMSLIREKRELQEHISLSPASHAAELQATISELETKNSEQRANYEAEISELRANLDAANSEVEAVADEFTRRKSIFQATVERVGQDLERCHGTLFDGMDDFWKSFPTFKRGTLSRIDSSADSQTYGLPSNDNDLALGRLSLHDQQPSASSAAFEETDLTAPEDSGRIASSPTISSRSDEVARRLRDYQGYPRSPSLEQDSESAPASVTPIAKKSVERTEALASPGLQQPLAASSRSPWHLGTGQFRETGWTTAAHGLQRSPGLRPWEEPGMFGQSTLKMEDASFAALNPPKITPGPANTDSRYAQINPMGQFATPGPPQQQTSSTSALPSTQRLPAEAMPPGSSTVKKAQGQPARSAGASSAVGPSSKAKADPIKALRESNKPRFSTSQSPSMSSAKAAAAQQAPRKALVPKGQEGPQSTIKPGPATNRVPDPRSITPARTSPMNYAGAVAKSPSASSTDSEALLTMTPAEIQAAADRDRVRKGLPPRQKYEEQNAERGHGTFKGPKEVTW